MPKQSRSENVVQTVLDAVSERLINGDELRIRIPEICAATGVNYGSVYHHFGSREGVIDAAYNRLFSELAEQDLAYFASVNDSATSLEEYLDAVLPIISTMTMGDERRQRRVLRNRIVAAATTRPKLRELIAATQTRLTSEWTALIRHAQERQWLRSDIAPNIIAVMIQALHYGRALDDVSTAPVDEESWSHGTAVMFVELLKG